MSSEPTDPDFIPFNNNPDSVERNLHHTGDGFRNQADYNRQGYYDTEPANPDNTGEYPGETDLNYQQINRVDRGKEYDDTNG